MAGDVDVATAREESYPRPGALPVVTPGGLRDDLARRDFSVNAIAIPLTGGELIDPHDGVGRSAAVGLLRALTERSFVDDPTRALRAARYASRLGFEVETETLARIRDADLETVSAERVEAELRRMAAEPDPVAGLGLLVDWGLVEADRELAAKALAVLDAPQWAPVASRADVLLAASGVAAGRVRAPTPLAAARELAGVLPERPSICVLEAQGHSGVELVLARALGAGVARRLRRWMARCAAGDLR